MTPKSLCSELAQLFDLMLSADIALYVNGLNQRQVTTHSKNAVRVSYACQYPVMLGTPFFSVEQYHQLVGSGAYSVVLFDGALLQISYDFVHDGVVGHRLCYYPPPYDMDLELLRIDGLADVVDLYRESGDPVHLRSPLRFDYDLANAHDGHPAVHLHVVMDHCRIPISSPLSPGHFVRFVFRSFYPQMYDVHEFIRKWNRIILPPTITYDEQYELHLACRNSA